MFLTSVTSRNNDALFIESIKVALNDIRFTFNLYRWYSGQNPHDVNTLMKYHPEKNSLEGKN